MNRIKIIKHGKGVDIELSFENAEEALSFFQDKERFNDFIEAIKEESIDDEPVDNFKKSKLELEKYLRVLEKCNNSFLKEFSEAIRTFVDEVEKLNIEEDAVRD